MTTSRPALPSIPWSLSTLRLILISLSSCPLPFGTFVNKRDSSACYDLGCPASALWSLPFRCLSLPTGATPNVSVAFGPPPASSSSSYHGSLYSSSPYLHQKPDMHSTTGLLFPPMRSTIVTNNAAPPRPPPDHTLLPMQSREPSNFCRSSPRSSL